MKSDGRRDFRDVVVVSVVTVASEVSTHQRSMKQQTGAWWSGQITEG